MWREIWHFQVLFNLKMYYFIYATRPFNFILMLSFSISLGYSIIISSVLCPSWRNRKIFHKRKKYTENRTNLFNIFFIIYISIFFTIIIIIRFCILHSSFQDNNESITEYDISKIENLKKILHSAFFKFRLIVFLAS